MGVTVMQKSIPFIPWLSLHGWYEWRKRFWTKLAAGGTFWQAINYANSMPQSFYDGWGVATPNRRIKYDGNSYQTIYD
jgi:hypothetical protein